MRKRIWYSFYVWDRYVFQGGTHGVFRANGSRLLALELGKPMLINDDECDTEYPQVLDEERLVTDDIQTPLPPTLLLASVHVARLLAPAAASLRRLVPSSSNASASA